MRGIDSADGDVPARHGRRDPPRRRDDPVTDDAVLGRVQFRYADNGQRRGAGAGDLCAHLVEHVAQIDHVRFSRGVVNRGHTLGDDGGHQNVLRRTNRRELKLNLSAAKVVGGGHHAAVLNRTLRTKLTQSGLVHVERPRSDRVTTGQCDACTLAAADERTEDAHRSAELPNRSEVGLVLRLVG